MEDNFKILYKYSKESYKPQLYSNIYRGFNRDTKLLPKEKEFILDKSEIWQTKNTGGPKG